MSMGLPTLTAPPIPCREDSKTSIILATVIIRQGCGEPPGTGPEYLRWTPAEMGPNGVTRIDDIQTADVITAASASPVDTKFNGRSLGVTVQLQENIDSCKLAHLAEGVEPDTHDNRTIMMLGDRTGQSLPKVGVEIYYYRSVAGSREYLFTDIMPRATVKLQNRSAFSSSQTSPTLDVMLMAMIFDDDGNRMMREFLKPCD